MKKIYLLLLAIFCSIGMSWGDSGDFYGVYIAYSLNGEGAACDLPSDGNNTKNLGTLTGDFKVTGIYLKCWDDWGNNFKFSTPKFGYYDVFNSADIVVENNFNRTSKDGNNYEFQRTDEITIASSTLSSGKYTFWFYFSAYGQNWETRYIKDGSNNFGWSYTILPPAVENLSISGAIAGSGTEVDPYIFVSGTNMTISAEQAHTDANSVLNQTSKTISENGSVDICYHNGTDDLNGPSTTIYYAVVSNPIITISNVGYTTYYNSKYAYTLPTGVEGYIFNASTRKIEKVYDEGTIVPAGEALVLKGSEGEKTLVLTTTANAKNANNALLGTDDQTILPEDDNSYFYGLSLNAAGETSSVGFYWMNETGAAFTNGTHKAYLKLAKSLFSNQAPAHFFFEDEEQTATGIEAIETVEQATKFVENGKIVVLRNGVKYDVVGRIVK